MHVFLCTKFSELYQRWARTHSKGLLNHHDHVHSQAFTNSCIQSYNERSSDCLTQNFVSDWWSLDSSKVTFHSTDSMTIITLLPTIKMTDLDFGLKGNDVMLCSLVHIMSSLMALKNPNTSK